MSSDNLRRPPAYQEYAADLLAREDVKLASLEELGLLWLMRLASWAGDTLPADPRHLARVLGRDESEVRANLSPAVMAHFEPAKGHSERLECTELAAQMRSMLERRRAQSAAADRTNAKRRGDRDGERNAKRSGKRVAPEMRGDGMKAFSRGRDIPTAFDREAA